MFFKMMFVLNLLIVINLLVKRIEGSEQEHRLVDKLFGKDGKKYNPLIRPSNNHSEPIVVHFEAALIQIISVDERIQVMKTNMWLRLTWHDYQFRWDPKEFGDIQVLRIEADRIWQPDIVLFNNADGKYEISYKCRILVSADGTVNWIPPTIYKSSCQIDVRYFPFDQQTCDLKFGSWTFNANEVKLAWKVGPWIDLNDYTTSGTWEVVDGPGNITFSKPLNPSIAPTTMMVYNVILRRKTLFYVVNLIAPCVMISFLSVCVFYLPAIACEKITLSISILLALVVNFLLLQKSLPPAPVLPLLANYLLFTFILNIISIVITVAITNWSFRTSRTHAMPRWIKVLLLGYLPKMMFMQRPNHERWRDTLKPKRSESSLSVPGDSLSNLMNDQHFKSCSRSNDRTFRTSEDGGILIDVNSRAVRRSAQAVNFIANHLKGANDYENVVEDWQYAGFVLDRLMLIIFLTVTLGGTLKIILDNPHIFDKINEDAVKKEIAQLRSDWNGPSYYM